MKVVFHLILNGALKKGNFEINQPTSLSLRKLLQLIKKKYGIALTRALRTSDPPIVILLNGEKIDTKKKSKRLLSNEDELTILSQYVGG